jgi:hypothetical protein
MLPAGRAERPVALVCGRATRGRLVSHERMLLRVLQRTSPHVWQHLLSSVRIFLFRGDEKTDAMLSVSNSSHIQICRLLLRRLLLRSQVARRGHLHQHCTWKTVFTWTLVANSDREK